MEELPTAKLACGEAVPALGLGTWRMGERTVERAREAAALRLGLDLGLRLIDTAEMYGEGGAEQVVAEAIAGRRDDVFLVSKVYPHNATAAGCIAACERSLKRLRTDRIDLYLLHWRGGVPLADTIAGFERLARAGKIRHWGVSNFDRSDMEELMAQPGGGAVQCNQVLYNLARRGVEFDLMPWQSGLGIPLMAYSPIEQGRLASDRKLAAIARDLGATAAELALAWCLRRPGIIPIPKAVQAEHVRQIRRAAGLRLQPESLAALDRIFPPPSRAVPLEMI
ncbi:MAG: aldo/keto reductase [Alphaproteobacteria bacterium]|nr:aldo/keto reductase [Alphaproteobacteria bacterium]